MYKQELLDHYHHSPYKGSLPNPDFRGASHNPSCGDTVSFSGNLKNGQISDLKFDGTGCVISQASASILAQYCINKTVQEIMNIEASTLISLIGIALGPTRIRCALLSLEALQQAVVPLCKGNQCSIDLNLSKNFPI